MPKLITAQQVMDVVEDQTLDATTTEMLIDAVEQALEQETGQFFGAEAVVTDEPHNGEDWSTLYANRPVKTLTSIATGWDKSGRPILVSDVLVNGRKLYYGRGIFPHGEMSVWLTYTAAANLPAIAARAVLDACVIAIRKRGSEEVTREILGPSQRDFVTDITVGSMLWNKAIETLLIPALG